MSGEAVRGRRGKELADPPRAAKWFLMVQKKQNVPLFFAPHAILR